MIEIDTTPIEAFFALPPDQMLLRFLLLFGWLPIIMVFLWGFKELWLNYVRQKYADSIKYTLLAIDIPRGNAQSPKAVESIFTYLAGAHSAANLIEKYWLGEFQLSFSFEVVSIDGYTQYLVHTPVIFRNLVESAIYSQYPDAEITEVNDYTENVPTRFPDEEYELFGGEFVLAKKNPYPIKMYEEFLHQMGAPEEQFKDPMASLMDLYSTLNPGEQAWFQIILTPTDFSWTEEGDKEISRILGEKKKTSDNIADKMINMFVDGLWSLSELFVRFGEKEEKKKEDELSFKMMNLKPKEKKQIESINIKASKLGFKFKIRFLYLAKRDLFNKPKVASGFIGFIKQFAALDLNNLKPDSKTSTSTEYFFTESRKQARRTRLMSNYKRRDHFRGRKPGIMNIEELATIWHFPVEAVVKAPLIQKAPGRKAEPPMSLPLGEETVSEELFTRLSPGKSAKDSIFADSGQSKSVGLEALKDSHRGKEAKKDTNDADEPIFIDDVEKKGSPPPNLPFA